VNQIINANTPGAYALAVVTTGAVSDNGQTLILIIEPVVVTGSVATYLAFEVEGVAEGVIINGDTDDPTSTSSTPTTLPFGLVSPGVRYVIGQDISVATNASNGFTVTVEARDELRAENDATIDSFFDGTGVGLPQGWASPSATPGTPDTYGHWGLTTEDVSLSDGASFVGALYAGDFIQTPREVMYATTSADGTTAHIGATRVGYKLEISAMQESAQEYTTELVYVVTPIF
jgi:hypothetical protein